MTTVAAFLFCAVLAGLTLFQAALIVGMPIGRFAWGGQHRVLPMRLRAGSAISILLYAAFAAIALHRAGILEMSPLDGVTGVAMWVLGAYFLLGVGLNLASRSRHERLVMTPVAAVLAALSITLAAS